MQEQRIQSDIASLLSQLNGEQIDTVTSYLHELSGENEEHKVSSDKYLTFWCNNQLFGIGIGQVVQIVHMMDITPLPDFPSYIKGILLIRGELTPIMDLRLRLGQQVSDYSERTCIILIRIDSRSFGLIVDAVNDVETISPQDICPPPQQSDHKANYLIGIAQRTQVILLLDVDYILSEKEIGEIIDVSNQTECP